jgi:hypothetical protein
MPMTRTTLPTFQPTAPFSSSSSSALRLPLRGDVHDVPAYQNLVDLLDRYVPAEPILTTTHHRHQSAGLQSPNSRRPPPPPSSHFVSPPSKKSATSQRRSHSSSMMLMMPPQASSSASMNAGAKQLKVLPRTGCGGAVVVKGPQSIRGRRRETTVCSLSLSFAISPAAAAAAERTIATVAVCCDRSRKGESEALMVQFHPAQ